MKKSRKVVIISLIVLFILLIGFSYAYWRLTKNQTDKNIVNSKCFSVSLEEASSGISLEKAFPILDSEGKVLSPYTFTITNTCDADIKYQVNLETLNTTTLGKQYVKAVLNNDTPQLLSNYDSTSTTLSDASSSNILKTGYLRARESITYNLRLWVDQDTPLDAGQNKTFASKIVVVNVPTIIYDESGASTPELYDGLIAVTYDSSGNVIVADTSKSWYNYTNHEWANAVLVDRTLGKTYTVGSTIPMSEILQMYVWIPRYRYQLWNTNNESSSPRAINIIFEDKNTTKSTGSSNGEWLTHPAFTFGSTELNGIWVGKFENSNGTLTNSNDLTNIQIKPNVISMVNVNVSNMFNAVRNIELNYSSRYGLTSSQVDTHMMKNMEWGAVAYLTNSIYGRYNDAETCISSGCEVWINNTHTGTGCQSPWTIAACGGTVTGCSGTSVSAGQDNNRTTCQSGYDWTTLGVNASTTGNMYGLYDMSGGAWEYVMGNMVNSGGTFYSSSSGFGTAPESKYYDSYAYSESTYTNHERGKLGDATRETLANFGSSTGGWYSDYAFLPYGGYSWFARGGGYSSGAGAGVFYFDRYTGGAYAGHSFRSVLTAE